MSEQRPGQQEGLNDLIDQIIAGALKKSNGSKEDAIKILRENLNKKIDSQDQDKTQYSQWYYLALAKLRGDEK